MAELRVFGGFTALLDEEDLDVAVRYKWHTQPPCRPYSGILRFRVCGAR